MSSAAVAMAGGGAPSGAADDSAVYRAVAAGATVNEVRRAIERSSSAAVNYAAGADGETPLGAARRLWHRDLICLLLESGAKGAGHDDWHTAVMWCVDDNDLARLRRLTDHGASVNTVEVSGYTPLMRAYHLWRQSTKRRDMALEIFRRSSDETRRTMCHGYSTLDFLIGYQDERHVGPWCAQMIVELLAAGASVLPHGAARAVPAAAAHAALREAELAALPPLGHDWRAQEAFVRLSLDVGELREAQQMVSEQRARLGALERELGSGTDSGSSSSEDESDSGSESESEEGEGTGSGGGSGGSRQ